MTTNEMALSIQPGLTVQFPHFEDVLVAAVYGHHKGLNGVAADLDMSPSELTKRLGSHRNEDGERETRPLRCKDFVGILASTGDMRPVYWLNEKFLESADRKRERAIDQFSALAPLFAELAHQAGFGGKVKR